MFSTSFWIAGLLSFLASAQAVKTTGTDGEYARLNTNIELNGFPAGFALTLGVFDKDAEDKRREIQLPVVWETEARLQQKDGDPAPMRLTDCIDKGEISNSSDTLWIVDVKQNWVGEDKGERKALYAMNQIVAARHSDHVCDTMILGLKKDKCLEHLGKNKPGTTHPFVCQTDEERPEGLPEGAYPFEGLMILGPTGKEVKGYNEAKLD